MRACPIASDEASLQPSSDGPWEGGVGGGAWWFEVAVAATAASCCSRRPPAAVKGAWLGRPEGSMTRRRLAARSEGWTRRSAVREALHDEKLSGRGEVHWSERGLWPARCAVTGGNETGVAKHMCLQTAAQWSQTAQEASVSHNLGCVWMEHQQRWHDP